MSDHRLSNLAIAQSQLFHAVDLFLNGEELVCAITLAGAAEEILGKMVEAQRQSHALSQSIERLTDMITIAQMNKLIPNDIVPPKRKEFVTVLNATRDACKHYRDGAPLMTNLNQEAYSLIRRAIKNFKTLKIDTPLEYRMKFAQVQKVFAERSKT